MTGMSGVDSVLLGARVAACDVMDYVNDTITITGHVDGYELRSFLLDYWMNAGGFVEDGASDGQG
jgi:hypothetical protein